MNESGEHEPSTDGPASFADESVSDDSTPVFRDVSGAVLARPISIRPDARPGGVEEDSPHEDKIVIQSHTLSEGMTSAVETPAPALPAREFDSLVLENFEKIRRRVAVLCRDDPSQAEDIAQEACVIACERWSKISEMENPVGYVMMIAWNLGIAWAKTRQRQREAYPQLAAAAEASETPTETVIARIDLERAILKLGAEQQKLLGLALSGLSANEIGALLGIPVGTVRTRLFRARKALKALLEEPRGEKE